MYLLFPVVDPGLFCFVFHPSLTSGLLFLLPFVLFCFYIYIYIYIFFLSKNGGTPLHSAFCFSYMRRGKNPKPEGDGAGVVAPNSNGASAVPTAPPAAAASPPAPVSKDPDGTVHPYENSIKTITTVTTVEEFWKAYDYLRRPNDLPTTTDYHFFKDGIKPTWEDPHNARGGKWIVRLPKGLASRYWEEVILALIGGQFPGIPDGEICGLVISIRYSEDILGIWNRSAHDREMIDRLRDAIKRVLQLPSFATMEYKPHQTSIQDKSSFRNTQAWKPKSLEVRTQTEGARETRRSGSWGEREGKPTKGRDLERSWR